MAMVVLFCMVVNLVFVKIERWKGGGKRGTDELVHMYIFLKRIFIYIYDIMKSNNSVYKKDKIKNKTIKYLEKVIYW